MLAIQKFLIEGGTIELLKEKFAIDAKRHSEYNNLILFKYDQIDSPFSEEIVREARGIVLDEKNNWNVVCWSMYKFFNQGEFYAAEINWKTAKVYEKLDGSLIQIFPYDGKWLVATSGSFASGNVGTNGFTFNDLFYQTFKHKFPSVDCRKCFFFELTSLYNKIVVLHPEPKITLLGGRDLVFLKEIPLDEAHIYFPDCERVKIFPLQSFNDIIESFKTFSGLKQEGFVVFDGINRQKCKHPEYIAAHRLKDSLGSKRSIVDVVRSGEVDEVISTLPEYKEVILEAKNRFDKLVSDLEFNYEEIKNLQPQKTFALAAVKTRYSPALFAFRAKKTNSIRSFFSQLHIDRLVELLNYKTNE